MKIPLFAPAGPRTPGPCEGPSMAPRVSRWTTVVERLFRLLVVVLTLSATWLLTRPYFHMYLKSKSMRSVFAEVFQPPKCGTETGCRQHYFAFRIFSGAANVVGPSICFEDTIIMSSVKDNIGHGLNIALLNGTTGELLNTGFFNMYSGDEKLLLDFMKLVKPGTLILLASFDDPASKLNDEARQFFTDMGSTYASKVQFRDNWIFVGGSGLALKTPFEQHLKNDQETNMYNGWPEVIRMEGCIPRKMG